MASKHIFVTGGVVSGLGKGISAASLGRLLKQRGLRVAAQKLDPYVNVDPGTMSPYQHGEVFVTEDGVETDLDLGHYERFIDEDLNKLSNLTSGRVYWNVLHKERAGEYLGHTVQIIPHVTGEIKRFVYGLAEYTQADVVITEIGGTIGDIESQPFLEAIRQISREVGRENCMFLHVVLVPWLKCSGEHKTKPAQHSVHELQSMGIMPDVIIARCDEPLEDGIRQKMAAFCNVEPECVIENQTLDSLYDVPLMLHNAKLDDLVCRRFGFDTPEPDLTEWKELCRRTNELERTVRTAIATPQKTLYCGYLKIRRDGAWLRIQLPSGRAVCYPSPVIEKGNITYMGVNSYSRKWQRLKTYGGKLVENVTQAAARDVLAGNMPLIEDAGYSIVLTVHDEVITESPDTEDFNDKALSALLSTNPEWAPDIPLNAGGFEAYHYRKD